MISIGDFQQQLDKLQHMGVEEYFNCVITFSEVDAAIPDKLIFMKAFLRTNSPIESCFYVGDRFDTDALGSKRDGMTNSAD